MLLHVPKTGHVFLHASKVKRIPIPCGLQTAGNNARIYYVSLNIPDTGLSEGHVITF
jgi:hypothetical protein